MHRLAMMSASAALVIKEATINENGPLYVRIVGRKPGFFAWLLNLIKIDSTTIFEVYEDRIEFSEGSLSGRIKETIPLTRICNLGTGYMKPFIYLILAGISIPLIFAIIGIITLPLFLFLYFFNKSMILFAIPNSGSGASIVFKRSLIEGVNLTEEDANRVIGILMDLTNKASSK